MSHSREIARRRESGDSAKKELLQVLAQAVELRDGDSRLDRLIANFDGGDGFAKGWRMAVGECFRDSLDIIDSRRNGATMIQRRTPRNRPSAGGPMVVACARPDASTGLVVDALDEAADRANVAGWTQGGVFSFSLGDTIYDTPQAYQRWDLALKTVCLAYQVLAASPSRPRKDVVYMRRNPAFTGHLKPRQQEVLAVIPSRWMEKKKVKRTTRTGTTLLQKLCDVGALEQKIEVEPRFPGMVRFRTLTPNAERTCLRIREEKAISQDDFVALLIAGGEVVDESSR